MVVPLGDSRAVKALRRLRPRPLVIAASVLLVAATAAYALLHSALAVREEPSGVQAPPSPSGALALALAHSEQGILDSDHDGLSDALENYVYGTDPLRASTSGSGIPDGWLVQFGFDPRDPAIGTHPAAAPAATDLPPSYHGVWPDRFVPTLLEVYRYNRPATWNESADGPFRNGLDPGKWDSNRDGIPDGWLLYYHLDPLAKDLAGKILAGPGGLTVREAFEHGTDPGKLDTDGDGIPDKEEIEGPSNPLAGANGPQRFPPTDPTRFDTSGAGVCDGYLRAYGLDPNSAVLAYGDLAHSGATTREKFLWSQQRFGAEACATGKGLSPIKLSTKDLPIPDGWLMRYGLDPLDASIPDKVVQDSATDPVSCAAPVVEGAPPLKDVKLTVLDKYRYGRFPSWQEARDGPWWGGMDPTKLDTDGDGIPDATELRGYSLLVSTQVGPLAKPTPSHSDSDPTLADSDGDGLSDGQEICPSLREFGKDKPPTDARRRDTDFDGIDDGAEMAGGLGLDPTRADTPGDYLRDGERYSLLTARAARYAGSLAYEYPSHFTLVSQWLQNATGAAAYPKPLTSDAVAQLVGPLGKLDGRTPNILNPDLDNDTLLNGWEVHPELYAFSPYGTGPLQTGRPATDPLNPDTDGDGLRDGWEVKYGQADFHASPPRYDLDPSRYDSGSGSCPDGAPACSDGLKDFPHNTLTWYSYTGTPPNTARKEPANLFRFNNLLKQQYDWMDPHKFSSDGDGLGDGWKIFWGITYKSLSSAAELGSIYPGAEAGPNAPLSIPASLQNLIQPGQNQTGARLAVIAEYAYKRFSIADPTDPKQRLPWETLDDPDPNFQVPGSPSYTVHRLKGSLPITLQVAQAYGLNPYMVSSASSSDGDQMADGWEVLHRELKAAGFPGMGPAGCDPAATPPDPALPDSVGNPLSVDPDQDGLSNLQEFLAGTSPVCTDTDMGKTPDGAEVADGSKNPADPTDDLVTVNANDLDGDGIPDFLERTGVHASTIYSYLNLPPGVALRTDPASPDTSGSGLLDGGTVPDPGTAGWPLDGSPEGLKARKFMDLGIASYSNVDSNGVTRYHFWGQADPRVKGDPRLTFAAPGVPIPLGWLVAHGLQSKPEDYPRWVPYYELGRPAWWDERLHGPWWGGADPTSVNVATLQQTADIDCDGLKDHRGGSLYEDPFPFSNPANHWRAVAYQDYGLADPAPGADPTPPASLNPTVERLWAQSFFNLTAQAGRAQHSTASCPPGDPNALQPSITGIALGDGTVGDRSLVKGVAATVTGQVVDPGGHGLPHITVEAGLLDESANLHVFGAGFTDGQGGFSFPVDVAPLHSVALAADPAHVGLVLRGQTSGTVNWTEDPSAIATGDGKTLYLQTYATAATPPFAGQVPVLLRAQGSLPQVVLRAGSALSFPNFPSQALAQTPVPISARLVDSAGTPLASSGNVVHMVRITVGSEQHDAQTDADGIASATFLVSPTEVVNGAGQIDVHAETLEPSGGFISYSDATTSLAVRMPATLALEDIPAGRAGSAVEVSGTLMAPQGSFPDAPVWVNITGPGSIGVPPATGTAHAGRFTVSVPLPAALPFGDYAASVSVSATQTTAAAADSRTLQILSLPILQALPTAALQAEGPALVSGLLLEPDGATPIAGAALDVGLDTQHASVNTSQGGAFSVSFPGPLPDRPLLQTVSFAGDARHAPAQAATERVVLVKTRMAIPGGVLARGAAASVPIRLLTTSNVPVPNALIHAQWGDEATTALLTNPDGVATFRRAGDPADHLGPVALRAWYNGSADGLWGPSSSSAVWAVKTLARLDLPGGVFDAGSFIPPGILQDAGTHAPLANAHVRIRLGAADASATTNDDGRFPLLSLPPRDADPFTVHIRVDYAGDAVYPPTSAEANLTVRSPVTLTPRPLPFIVAGQPTAFIVELRDGRGQPVEGGRLNATMDGAAVGSAPARGGFALAVLTLPANRPAGDATLHLGYNGTLTSGAAAADVPVRVLAPVQLTVTAEAAKPGQVARVRVVATAGGQPLGFAAVQLDVAGLGGLHATTDKDGVATFLVPQGNATLLLAARYGGTAQLGPALATASLVPLIPETPLQAGLRIGVWLAAGAAVLLVAIAVAVRRLRRHPLDPALRRARRAILGRGPYESQIILAYRILEDSAIAHELMEAPANTPRGLQEALAATIDPSVHPSLERLIALFEQARYGNARLGPAHRDAAAQALDTLRRQLAGMDPLWPKTLAPKGARA